MLSAKNGFDRFGPIVSCSNLLHPHPGARLRPLAHAIERTGPLRNRRTQAIRRQQAIGPFCGVEGDA